MGRVSRDVRDTLQRTRSAPGFALVAARRFGNYWLKR